MDSTIERDSKWKNGYIYAVRLLTIVNRGSLEITKRLIEKGYEREIAESIVSELEKRGLLNDRKLSHDTVRWGVEGKRLGRLRLQAELKKRGIRSESISEALGEYSKNDEAETAQTVARERWDKLERIEPKLRKKRVYDFLLRRGFDFELSRSIIEKIGKEPHEDS